MARPLYVIPAKAGIIFNGKIVEANFGFRRNDDVADNGNVHRHPRLRRPKR